MRGLHKLKIGESGLIVQLLDSNIKKHMLALGLLPNKRITVIRKDLFNDCIIVQLEYLKIALRKIEATKIIVE